MMIGSEYLSFSVHLATMVVPVAVYFLILGLLNSRHRPQLLSARLDFAILIVALAPLVVIPVLNSVGISLLSVSVALLAVAGVIVGLSPRSNSWVIYNLTNSQAKQTISRTLRSMRVRFDAKADGFALKDHLAFVRVSGFPLLRNISVRIEATDPELAEKFQANLTQALGNISCETLPSAAAMLLVATAMIVAPLTMFVHRVPEIVRLITDLLY